MSRLNIPIRLERFASPSRLRVLALSLLILLLFATAQTGATTDRLSTKQRDRLFAEVWQTINDKYYDPSFNGVDWSAVRQRYQAQLDSVKSDQEFYILIKRMVAELHDAHTRFYSPDQHKQRKHRQVLSVGVSVFDVEGRPTITQVRADSIAAQAGITAGLVISKIDGQPATDRIAALAKEIGKGSSERHEKLLIYGNLLAGPADREVELTLIRPDGSEFNVRLPRQQISSQPKVTANLLPSGFGYLKFTAFQPSVVSQVKSELIKLQKAPGLILDLRGNGGGNIDVMSKIGDYFLNEKLPVGKFFTRGGKPPSFFLGLVKLQDEVTIGNPGKQIYPGRMVVLINESTGSAAETLVNALQEHQRAVVIGNQSCGCVLGILKSRELKDGSELEISETGFISSKGRKLEGNGVLPDRTVKITIKDLSDQRDAVLAEAESYLQNQTRPANQ